MTRSPDRCSRLPGRLRIETLIGEIERPTLREALDEFYDETGNMVTHKEPADFDITQQMPDMYLMKVALCPECGADGYCEMCEACGGTGQATENEGLATAR